MIFGPALAALSLEGETMAGQANVARVRDGHAAFAEGDSAAHKDLFAEDLLWHVNGRSQLAGGDRGREAVFGFFGKLMEAAGGSLYSGWRGFANVR